MNKLSNQGRTLMLQGTASDVGKSVITAAICRILLQDGWSVAPFKSQNMSLNSYVTLDGKEIGRAQGMQADACKITATTDMNPILLKPTKEMTSQVIVHGKPYASYNAREYRESFLPQAESIVKEALRRLTSKYDIVVLEGAGSPAEVNLKDRDIVNMRMADWANAPVILIGDIDRGGVFASFVGTLEILSSEERKRVKGFVINKFRGDVSLLKSGVEWLEQKTGIPVLGVIPFMNGMDIEDEDSASLLRIKEFQPQRNGDQQLDIGVIALPRISNFTDFDPLIKEEDVHLRYIRKASEWGNPDAVIIPGSKNTLEDLHFIKEQGLDELLLQHQDRGGFVVGICGGYQMLGASIKDPDQLESELLQAQGLGLIPSETVFLQKKKTVQVIGQAETGEDGAKELPIHGFEIHMGRTRFVKPVIQPFTLRIHDAELDSVHREGVRNEDWTVFGTYVHGVFHNDDFRRFWLNRIRVSKGWTELPVRIRFMEEREAAFDKLAQHVRDHLDMEKVYEMLRGDVVR